VSAMLCTLLIAGVCMASLRANRPAFHIGRLAILIICLSCGLLFVRHFDAHTRLLGYGILLGICALQPARWADRWWVLYGLIGLVVGVINAKTTNTLGANDARYEI